MNILSIVWDWNPSLITFGDFDIRWYGLMWAVAILVAERICNYTFSIPWFKHFDKAHIDRYIEAVHKVAANIDALKNYKGEAAFAFWS